jgi:hypothetical protein
MFKRWLGKQAPAKPQAPEILGLYLGGSFELDRLNLELQLPELTIETPATQHLIQAVGEVRLDSGGKILRYYTDDDAFLQIILDGGDDASCITDVKLWYFFSTTTVGDQAQWDELLKNHISQASYELDNQQFTRVWNAVAERSPPVAMTERTYELDGDISDTDQFVMLYERQLSAGRTECLLVSAEEKRVGDNFDRCLVLSTGIDLAEADLRING